VIVQRWILARLRHQRFFSLAELNSAIAGLVEQLNDRTMRGLGATRRTLFEQFDRPALLALPPVAYEYAEWRRCRVGLDYHVGVEPRGSPEIDKRFYSVPHDLLRQEVEVRITAGTVEVFHRGKRVASHVRSASRHPSTTAEHMPSAHRRYQDWTHERIRREAAAVGDDTATLADLILRSRPHPEQGFRSCPRSAPPIAASQTDRKGDGILGLVGQHGAERVDAACARALALGTRSYTSVAAILRHRRDQPAGTAEAPSLVHENIRGPGYYH